MKTNISFCMCSLYTFFEKISRIIIVFLLTGCSFLFFLGSSKSFAADWLHFGYDDSYTSYNSAEYIIGVSNVTQVQRQWGIGCDDGSFAVIFRSPAIYNGTLYTSKAGGRLTAYNAQTGQELWHFGTGNAGWAPQPVVSEDGVVFYMEDTIPTYLYAVNGQTGGQLWKAPIGFDLGYSGAAKALVTVDEANNIVYLVEDPFIGDGKLYALNKNTGAIVWYMSPATNAINFAGNYVLLRDGKIYVAANVNNDPPYRMVRVDAASQSIDMLYDRPEGFVHNPDKISYTLGQNKLFVGFVSLYSPFDSKVATYNINASAIIWEKNFSEITGKIAYNSNLNVIYVPTNPYLYALNADTGNEIWKYTGYNKIYNPSIANGVIYFMSDTNLYALNGTTGQKLFSYPLGHEGDETTQVAIDDGMLYFSGNGGTCDLFALGG